MTLTAWQKLVKPQRSVFITALLAALLGWLAASAWYAHHNDASLQAWGNSLATGLAATSAEPFMAQNHILLGVLANRMSALAEVTGVAVYDLDNQNLALISPPDGQAGVSQEYYFTAPIAVNDTIIGYVRISMQPPLWTTVTGRNVLAGLIGILTIALLLRVLPPWKGLLRGLRQLTQSTFGTETAESSQDQALANTLLTAVPRLEPHFLLVAKVHSSPTLEPEVQQNALSHGERQVRRVAALYGAQCLGLNNRGFALLFSSDEDQDRPFQVLCAGFLLAGCLQRDEATTEYRLGCHSLSWIQQELLDTEAPHIEDALLASACARPGQLAVTGVFFDQIPRQERLQAESLDHPLGENFTTADAQCHLITGLGTSYRNLIERQIAFLSDQSDDVASASTF